MGNAPTFSMNTAIYDKTDKGRNEIATRSQHLAPRLRTLLLLIDGRRSEQELLASVAGLGLTETALAELLAQGYIVLSRSYATLPAVDEVVVPLETAPAVVAPSTGGVQAAMVVDAVQQFQSVYNFYTKTIKSRIGLRGFTLQMKVEKAASIGDLRELRQPYLDAVLKAKGDAVADELRAQLDQLLDGANDAASA